MTKWIVCGADIISRGQVREADDRCSTVYTPKLWPLDFEWIVCGTGIIDRHNRQTPLYDQVVMASGLCGAGIISRGQVHEATTGVPRDSRQNCGL
jgi:hypothetical protein